MCCIAFSFRVLNFILFLSAEVFNIAQFIKNFPPKWCLLYLVPFQVYNDILTSVNCPIFSITF